MVTLTSSFKTSMSRDRKGYSLPVIGPSSSLKGRPWAAVQKCLGIEAKEGSPVFPLVVNGERKLREMLLRTGIDTVRTLIKDAIKNKIIPTSPGPEAYGTHSCKTQQENALVLGCFGQASVGGPQ
eukprot:1631414-Amphidinium_carterae.1